MKKFVLASVAALGVLGLAACSDETTTESVPPTTEQPAEPSTSTDGTATQPETAPIQPAPAQ